MGSGSLAAMSVFERIWKPNMTREAAVELAREAIEAGIWNDLGSGSNVDVAVITQEKTTLMRNMVTPNVREKKRRDYRFEKGTTAVLKQKVIDKEDIGRLVTVHELAPSDETAAGEKMETD